MRLENGHVTQRTSPEVDFGRAAADYARWRQGFPPEFYARLEELGVGLPGQELLDLGSGSGLMARAFARRGCRVTALDPSEALLAEARRQAAEEGLAIHHRRAWAEETGLEAGSFDAIAAGTCWHWFDRPKAAAECRRLLRPGGRLAIAHLDWLRLPGNVIDVTQEMIDAFNPNQRSAPVTFQYPEWIADLTSAGFDAWEVFGYSAVLEYSHEAWRGRIRASGGVGAAMDADTLARFDDALEKALAEAFPEEPLGVDHRVFALVLWTP